MPQNRATFSVPVFLPPYFTPQVKLTHKRPSKVSNVIQSSWTPTPTLDEVQTSMASVSLPGTSLGVLLPICLLAVFLSCVVCVYHWQSIRERRLDMEDERKRKRLIYASDQDGGCTLKSYKNKVRQT